MTDPTPDRRMTDKATPAPFRWAEPLVLARAVLARWGYHPTPPAEGEVGELVAALRSGDRWTQLTDDQVDRAADLLERLAGWKESALAVEREWDAHGIATMLGCQLGESQRACIQREVPRLLDKLRELEQRHPTPAETEA